MDLRLDPDGTLVAGDWRAAAVVGRSGRRRDKHEGDGATPIGRFALRRLFLRPDRQAPPPTRLACQPLAPDLGWCDDCTHPDYNRLITLPHPARHECLWRDDGVYDLLVVLGHNDDPVVPGAGSAIFLHLTRPDRRPTEGCVALDLPDLRALLTRCGPGDWLRVVG